MAIPKFRSGDFGEKMSMGGGLVVLKFLGLKNTARTSNFRSNKTSHDILGPLDRYDHPWEKPKKKNKHEFVIFLLAKNTKFHIFAETSLKPLQ